jgi:hypothetical protein
MKNRYLAIIKNESVAGLLLGLPFIIFYDLLAWGYMLIFRPSALKYFFSNFGLLRSALRKRSLQRRVSKTPFTAGKK